MAYEATRDTAESSIRPELDRPLNTAANLTDSNNSKLIVNLRPTTIPDSFGNFELTDSQPNPPIQATKWGTHEYPDKPGSGKPDKPGDKPDETPGDKPDDKPEVDMEAKFNKRMQNFRERIYAGVEQDQITPQEYERLERQMANLTTQYAEASKDGWTAEEQRKFNTDMQMQSLRIFRDRHNNDTASTEPGPDRLDIAARIERQHERIYRGADDHSLTEEEYIRRDRMLTNIESAYARLSKDGLTVDEKERIARRLDLSSLHIFHDRHDRDTATT